MFIAYIAKCVSVCTWKYVYFLQLFISLRIIHHVLFEKNIIWTTSPILKRVSRFLARKIKRNTQDSRASQRETRNPVPTWESLAGENAGSLALRGVTWRGLSWILSDLFPHIWPDRFASWWQLKYLLFSPRSLGKIPNLTSIFFNGGWFNHQPETDSLFFGMFVYPVIFWGSDERTPWIRCIFRS